MQLVIERGDLLKALSHVTSVVERRTTIPILSNVLLASTEGGLQLKATDLEREVVEQVAADCSQTGAVTVPAHMIHDIARKLPDGAQVSLTRDSENERVTVTSGQARFTLQALPADDFPDIAAGEMSHEFTMAAHELRRLIEKTRFAISTEETRYYLNGIYFHVAADDGQQTLRAVATDGHRLAQLDLEQPDGAADMPGVIIPRKTVQELHRLLDDTTSEVRVGVSDTKVRFDLGSVILTSKLIDGTFPDYARVIPRDNDKILSVANAVFTGAVDRVSTISSERGRAVKLAMREGKLVLSVSNTEGGSATEEVDVSYDAEPLEIGFNARYLLDISSQLDSDTAVFRLADAASPTVVRDGDDGNALYVLMPMRV
ncbi:MAG: DNA polymerase III subunit beta [Pseudomonadota bacterium]